MSQYRTELVKLVSPFSAGVGVEVGVHRGATSQALLRAHPKLTLWMVDPWTEHPQYPDQQKNFAEAMERTVFAANRRLILRQSSVAAAADPQCCDSLFDFVFIDADHAYESVKADIRAWWPRVKPGGLICGHDYHKPDYPGVTQAVDEWFARFHGGPITCLEAGNIWYWRKES